ncbi:MAG: 30S ribosomal protein S9 [Elusimicrobiota bacterium]
MSEATNPIFATGRRKNAAARVKVLSGSGKILVNGKTIDEFFGGLDRQKKHAVEPLTKYQLANSYDYLIDTMGGGVTGQSGAIRMGLARAIITIDPNMRPALKKEGFLTRDSRMVERKKPGMPKARKRFQFSKR